MCCVCITEYAKWNQICLWHLKKKMKKNKIWNMKFIKSNNVNELILIILLTQNRQNVILYHWHEIIWLYNVHGFIWKTLTLSEEN